MPTHTIYTLGEADILVSGGAQLSGITQGDGSHLVGESITLTSRDWETIQISDNDSNFNDNDGNQRLDGDQTVFGTNYDDNRKIEAEYQFVVEDPDGVQYTIIAVNIREPGSPYPAYGTVEGLAFIGPVGGFPPSDVPLKVISAAEGPKGSSTPFSSYASPPCFTPGTRIDTPDGPRAVEDFQPGDLVCTLDDGPQQVRWIGRTHLSHAQLRVQPNLAPILLRKGALGAGAPQRDMMLSPQHHLLLGGWQNQLYFGDDTTLRAAKHLVDGTTITPEFPPQGVTYLHLLFDKHQIIRAEGVETESFFPGPVTLHGLTPPQQQELFTLFPHLAKGLPYGSAARPVLRGWETRLLAA